MTPTKTAALEQESIRPRDPNVEQSRASDPATSVWVTASAGTGKTKVLTDRVLRLLLPQSDGRPGTEPTRILCLTFTKAGAGEMANRLTRTLARWAVMEESELTPALERLLTRKPSRDDILAARRLFAEVSDTPGGLKIMTIHSFCQSVLGRFPLEAGIAPHFHPLEETEARALLESARDRVLNDIHRGGKNHSLNAALLSVANVVNEEQFFQLVQAVAKEREQLERLLEDLGGIDGLYQTFCDEAGLAPGKTDPDQILFDACHNQFFDEAGLRSAVRALSASTGKQEPEWAQTMQLWLDASQSERVKNFDSWRDIFVKPSDGEPRTGSFPTKGVEQRNPNITTVLRTESDRVLQLADQVNAAHCALLTRDLLLLAQSIINEYQSAKQERAALDFDDMIFTTCALLEGRTANLRGETAAAWVLYKLDRGIDHILVDEAQDTNPEQWRVVEALTTEFASGYGARDDAGANRTLFVVGDEKQSIYSFQRASRELFESRREVLKEKITEAGRPWDDVPLNISFRSARSVLQSVDEVFNGPWKTSVTKGEVEHASHHFWRAGRVELWPLFETEKQDDTDPWLPPITVSDNTDGPAKLAAHIAKQVSSWIGKEQLPSYGRTVQPGDIMILFRTRNALFAQVAKKLKDAGIPISGTDRMILSEQIAVQDLLAAAQFALQPFDDLNLASLLKSPLIGMDEDTLRNLCYGRDKQPLWPRLIKHPDIKTWLDTVQRNAATLPPFDFFTSLLQSPCPANDISGLRAMQSRLGPDILDPLDELLTAALDFESGEAPSLQTFVQQQLRSEAEIKRELEEAGNCVRLMTVHGSKGLQAPIVILPDTTRVQRTVGAKADTNLLWPNKTNLRVPLWAPRTDDRFGLYTAARNTIEAREDDEYRRLLYVAMTRAEDRLYLAGASGKKTPRDDSWYFALRHAMSAIEDIEQLEDGTLRLDNKQTRDADKGSKETKAATKTEKLPDFLFQPAAEEKQLELVRPSKLGELEPPANSPLQRESLHRFRRGNLTHKLLEILPTLPESKHEAAAKNYLTRFAADIPLEIQNDIARETMNLLTHANFARVFGPGSLAEVPVTGRLKDGRIVSGQIDRLLVTEKDILIVDYKTNRPPPKRREDVPAIYEAQMRAYADILGQIYPGRTISCALLWTDGATLMQLEVPLTLAGITP